jgi:tRNA dimethylallyltransferase
MLSDPFRNALVLTGPTGSGKTALGIELADKLGAEIISMDSMALYRGMDIGTAKPSTEERARVPHHLIDVLDPWEASSVAWWLDQAARCSADIRARAKRILFVGGTPLYLKALLHGLFEGPPENAEVRRRLTEEAQQRGEPALHERLARIDPAAAARLHPNDLRRVVRALEVWELTGKPLSSWQTQWAHEGSASPQGALSQMVWLDLPRPELYARINARAQRMFAQGLVEEVRLLRSNPRPISRVAGQALGYKEAIAHLENQVGLEDTLTRVQTRTRNFAKRQLTWFRHLPGCRPAAGELTSVLRGLTIHE